MLFGLLINLNKSPQDLTINDLKLANLTINVKNQDNLEHIEKKILTLCQREIYRRKVKNDNKSSIKGDIDEIILNYQNFTNFIFELKNETEKYFNLKSSEKFQVKEYVLSIINPFKEKIKNQKMCVNHINNFQILLNNEISPQEIINRLIYEKNYYSILNIDIKEALESLLKDYERYLKIIRKKKKKSLETIPKSIPNSEKLLVNNNTLKRFIEQNIKDKKKWYSQKNFGIFIRFFDNGIKESLKREFLRNYPGIRIESSIAKEAEEGFESLFNRFAKELWDENQT